MNRDYPQEIEEQAVALAQITERRDEAQEALRQVEDAITADVLRETDTETGKPKFTNETARGIAIRERSNASGKYQQWKAILQTTEFERAKAAARLERLRGEFSESKLARRERIVSIEAAIN